MKYPGKVIKLGSKGEDVFFIKRCLFILGYYAKKITSVSSYTFGNDSVYATKNYQRANKDLKGRQLDDDGIIGELTWNAIVRDYNALVPQIDIPYTRDLSKGMYGEDVEYIKKILYLLKYLIPKPTHGTFGNDTEYGVKNAQYKYGFSTSGKIDKKTWDALVNEYKEKFFPVNPEVPKFITYEEFPNLAKVTVDKLNDAWRGLSQTRIDFMKLCIKHAYDAVNGTHKKDDPLVGMYIIGANLYDTKLNLFIPTAKYIEDRAKARPEFFSNGRKNYMLDQLKKNPNIAASDCSGMIVGVGRKLKLVSKSFDATADTLSTNKKYSTASTKAKMVPADWVARSGHIGVYVGADMVVEFAGGAYGCQLTNINKRRCWNLKTNELEDMKEWTRFVKPKWY